MEEVGVDAARPRDDVLETLRCEFVAHRGGRDHDAAGVFVEFADIHVAHPGGQEEEARRNVFGEARVIGGGVGKLVAQADRARRPAERAFGCDVDGVGFEFEEALLDDLLRAEGQLDLGIGRQRDRLEAVRRDDVPGMAHLLAFGDHALHRAHDAIDLRVPGVGYEHDAHCGRGSFCDSAPPEYGPGPPTSMARRDYHRPWQEASGRRDAGSAGRRRFRQKSASGMTRGKQP